MPGRQPDQRLNELAQKMLSGKITEQERIEFEQWYSSFDDTQHTKDSNESLYQLEARLHTQIFERAQIVTTSKTAKIISWPRIAVAASVLLIVAVGSYLLINKQPKPQQSAQIQQDLKPGSNGAILTLADGQKVVLEKAKVGAISTGIQKLNDSLLTYNAKNETIGYNTLETPKGRQYSVVLPDGSKVWLNAASSITYPTHFSGKERLVQLTGEAYFEVIHNEKMPFKVKTTNQITEDIGTSFNINSYEDEPATVTTLVEGAVKVNNKLLNPGYSAISPLSTTTTIKQADIEQITAWKNNAFNFNKTDIQTMMRQIARWYDVEVSFEGEIPKKTITGEVHRDVNASQALQILTYLNIHYRIEGKTIIITK